MKMTEVPREDIPDLPVRVIAASGLFLGIPVLSRHGAIGSPASQRSGKHSSLPPYVVARAFGKASVRPGDCLDVDCLGDALRRSGRPFGFPAFLGQIAPSGCECNSVATLGHQAENSGRDRCVSGPCPKRQTSLTQAAPEFRGESNLGNPVRGKLKGKDQCPTQRNQPRKSPCTRYRPPFGGTKTGRARRSNSVTFERSYKDDSGKWQSSTSFSGGELLLLAKAEHVRQLGSGSPLHNLMEVK